MLESFEVEYCPIRPPYVEAVPDACDEVMVPVPLSVTAQSLTKSPISPPVFPLPFTWQFIAYTLGFIEAVAAL